jgi:hypothetical protein
MHIENVPKSINESDTSRGESSYILMYDDETIISTNSMNNTATSNIIHTNNTPSSAIIGNQAIDLHSVQHQYQIIVHNKMAKFTLDNEINDYIAFFTNETTHKIVVLNEKSANYYSR